MIDDTRVFSRQVAYGLSGVGLLLAAMVFALIHTGAEAPHSYSQFAVNFTYLSTIVAIPLFLILGSKVAWAKLPAIIIVHFTMAVMLLSFAEINSSFTPLWSILVLFASIYYGWWGFAGSSLSLYAVSAAYVFLYQDQLDIAIPVYAALAGLVCTLTIIMSYLFVRIIINIQKKTRELAKAQQSELLQVTRLNTLLNNITDAVMTLNRYGRITSQNAAAQGFFDTNESLIGQDIDKLLLLKDGDEKSVSIRSVIDGVKSSSLRDDLSTAGEDTRHLSIQMARIRSNFDDSEEYGVVLIIRDITKQKTLEEEKDEFISVTSHELRTPVAIAEGSLSNFLLMQDRDMPREKLTDAAESAHKQIVYLSQMINDLSTLSRAERGIGDETEPVDVNEMLHNLFAKYTPQAEEKSLTLDLDKEHDLPVIETSHLYLEEILQNFLTNAIKYTKTGTVTFGANKVGDDKLRFYVRDSGIGIGKTDLQHIFEKFYRSEDYRTRETSGTGLGLYVVDKLAHKLGTRVEVESRLNVGSTFSFVMSAPIVAKPRFRPLGEDEDHLLIESGLEDEEPALQEVSKFVAVWYANYIHWSRPKGGSGMDPYEKARIEYEGMQQARPAVLRLTEKARQLRTIATSPALLARHHVKPETPEQKEPFNWRKVAKIVATALGVASVSAGVIAALRKLRRR